MAKTSRARSMNSGAKPMEPIGGRYYERYKSAVSGQFIESLRDEGVSAGTIHAIERDNATRDASRRQRTRGAA
jgi:hypothetical protein